MSTAQLLFLSSTFLRLSLPHQIFASVLCSIPYFLTYKTVNSTSSVINRQNHQQEMRRYPYDHVLYQPGQVCRTCQFVKPARSKHCGICNICVAKHDHHCIWLMNCLGRGNYIYFVSLMASLGLMLSYGAYLAYSLLSETLQSDAGHRLHGFNSGLHWSAGRTWSEISHSWAWAFANDVRVGGTGMLALLTAPLAWGLFWYHFYLIWAGMTTNETSKWADWRDDITDGLVLKSERTSNGVAVNQTPTEIEPFVDWPISTKQQLFSSHGGQLLEGTTAITTARRELPPSQQQRWRRVQNLAEVDNLYDLGFWDNLKDIIPKP